MIIRKMISVTPFDMFEDILKSKNYVPKVRDKTHRLIITKRIFNYSMELVHELNELRTDSGVGALTAFVNPEALEETPSEYDFYFDSELFSSSLWSGSTIDLDNISNLTETTNL